MSPTICRIRSYIATVSSSDVFLECINIHQASDRDTVYFEDDVFLVEADTLGQCPRLIHTSVMGVLVTCSLEPALQAVRYFPRTI
jgi:hypothetical protein